MNSRLSSKRSFGLATFLYLYINRESGSFRKTLKLKRAAGSYQILGLKKV